MTESVRGRPGAGWSYRDARFPVSFLPASCFINSAFRDRFRNQSAGVYTRHTALCKSPLTGGLADSQSGGYWGAELKFAGWDGIIVEGISPAPVYAFIEDDAVALLPADHLWGKATGEVQEILLAQHGERARVLQCGPAG